MIDIDILITWGGILKKVKAGEIIFHEGNECRFYYQLISGRIRWVNFNSNGGEFLQCIINSGECFGELPLFDDGCYAATAIADTDSVILRLDKSTFRQIISENPKLHFAFTRLLAERVRFKFFIVKEMAAHDPEHIIYTLLNYFRETKQNINSDTHKVNLTRQQIADMTGMRVETVIRTIKSLQKKNALVIEKGKVYY